MTHPMTDADLADLRNMLERSTAFLGVIYGRHFDEYDNIIPLGECNATDLRALVARLDAADARLTDQLIMDADARDHREKEIGLLARIDAAEDLIREVAQSGVEFDDERLDNVSVQIGRHEWNQCRSYLR